MPDSGYICLERQENPSNLQLHGYMVELKDDGRILAANIKYILAEEASRLPHSRSIPRLHDTVDQRLGLHNYAKAFTCKASHQISFLSSSISS